MGTDVPVFPVLLQGQLGPAAVLPVRGPEQGGVPLHLAAGTLEGAGAEVAGEGVPGIVVLQTGNARGVGQVGGGDAGVPLQGRIHRGAGDAVDGHGARRDAPGIAGQGGQRGGLRLIPGAQGAVVREVLEEGGKVQPGHVIIITGEKAAHRGGNGDAVLLRPGGKGLVDLVDFLLAERSGPLRWGILEGRDQELLELAQRDGTLQGGGGGGGAVGIDREEEYQVLPREVEVPKGEIALVIRPVVGAVGRDVHGVQQDTLLQNVLKEGFQGIENLAGGQIKGGAGGGDGGLARQRLGALVADAQVAVAALNGVHALHGVVPAGLQARGAQVLPALLQPLVSLAGKALVQLLPDGILPGIFNVGHDKAQGDHHPLRHIRGGLLAGIVPLKDLLAPHRGGLRLRRRGGLRRGRGLRSAGGQERRQSQGGQAAQKSFFHDRYPPFVLP